MDDKSKIHRHTILDALYLQWNDRLQHQIMHEINLKVYKRLNPKDKFGEDSAMMGDKQIRIPISVQEQTERTVKAREMNTKILESIIELIKEAESKEPYELPHG